MKRVVLIRSNPVNPNPAVEKVATALKEKGYRVTVLGWDRGEEYDERRGIITLPCGEVDIIRFGIPAVFSGGIKKNLSALIKFQKKMSSWLTAHKDEYDIVHAFDLDTGITAMRMAHKHKKGFVYQIQDFYAASRLKENTIFYELVKRIEFAVINNADATIICTEARKQQIAGSRPKNLAVVHNTPGYISLDEIEKLHLNPDRMKIAYVGCFEKIRLIKELIDCIAEDARFELHIGGFGILEDYVKESAEKCERIIYYGKLPYGKVLSLEASCDIMTALYAPNVANHKYTAPNKVYESMLLQKPVIMCKNTGWDDVLDEYGTGILIEPTRDGLKDGLDELYNKKTEWATMGSNGKALYNEKYSWSVMKERIQSLYAKLYE